MYRQDFHYTLPPELIAQHPRVPRSGARLLYMPAHEPLQSRQFSELPFLLRAHDVLVFNDTRVIPARLLGQKLSGGRVEVLVERVLDEATILAHVGSNKPLRLGTSFIFGASYTATLLERRNALCVLRFANSEPVSEMLEKIGQMPLPPYIKRAPEAVDQERYQTVYARHPGAVAAPTAGLHFDEKILAALRAQGIQTAFVTLHVGAGTFQPVRADNLREHAMHHEWLSVSAQTCEQLADARARGGRIIAVGTTVARSLETAARSGQLLPYTGETNLFIYPGYQFQCIDGLITNFHLPESTLLMLVCAFGGYERVMAAYRHAVESGYHFFSYGDAMLVFS